MPQRSTDKVLLLGSKAALGGAQRVQLQLADWLHRRGVRVSAAFLYDAEGLIAQWRQDYPFEIACLDAWQGEDWLPLRMARLLGGWLRLTRWLRRERFAAVLTFTHDSNLLGLPAAWLAGVPCRYGSHHGRFASLSAWKKWLHARLINSRMADGLVAVSAETRRQAIAEGVQPQRIVVIPNGVSLPSVSRETAWVARQALLPGAAGFLLLSAGRLVPEKGQRILIQAATQVLQEFPSALFAIAGDGPLRVELQALADSLGISDGVKLLGNRTDMPALLAACDIFVLSSLSEGLPMALLEAMAAGKALVSTDVGGIPAALDDGNCGLLVPAGDAPALANAMLKLLRDASLRNKLASRARKRACKFYSLDEMGENYLEILTNHF